MQMPTKQFMCQQISLTLSFVHFSASNLLLIYTIYEIVTVLCHVKV